MSRTASCMREEIMRYLIYLLNQLVAILLALLKRLDVGGGVGGGVDDRVQSQMTVLVFLSDLLVFTASVVFGSGISCTGDT